MFKRFRWRLRLASDQVLARLDERLIGEGALRERMTERLEAQFIEWRSANNPMGRIKGRRFRLFMPRETLRNPMAPVLHGRVVPTENGSLMTVRVGFSWKSILLITVLLTLFLCVAIPWMVIKAQVGRKSWAYILIASFCDPLFLGFVVIFGLFRWVARKDVKWCVSFLNEHFDKDVIHEDERWDSMP